MVDRIEKLLRKSSDRDRERLEDVLQMIRDGNTSHLDVKKLSGLHQTYRVRVGKYRVIFAMHQDGHMELISVARRSDTTYG